MEDTLQLILRSDIQKIFDNFAATVNKKIVFFSPDGKILTNGLNCRNAEFCRIIQTKIFGQERCARTDSAKMEESVKSKGLVCYRCHAGIQEAVIPIYVANQLAGFAMIGQFRTSHKISSRVKTACPSPAVYQKLESGFNKLPYYSPGKLREVLGMFSMLVDYIVTKELVTIHGNRIISRVNGYIDANLHHNIYLTEVAKHLGRSPSSISHFFRLKMNTSFKHHLLNRKLEKAEEYFSTNPEMSIEEVAEKVGFNDQFYFSRLYHKYRGMPPSEYRRNIRNK
jgi:AraC-like DNA-binding protein/ligand-binding sensor protein